MRYITLVLFVLLLCECNSSSNEYDSSIIDVITVPKKLSPVIFDSIVDNFYWIPLETDSTSLIGQVDKVVFSENRIFIQDMDLANAVFIFDRSGQLINTLRGGGQGPGEFVRPRSISVDYIANELVIMDDRSQRLNIYNENGEFISSVKIKQTSNDIAKIDDGVFALNSGYIRSNSKYDFFDLSYVNSYGKTMNKFRPLPKWRFDTDFLKSKSFSNEQSEVYYTPVYCDTVFYLTGNSVKPRFFIDLGDDFINSKTAGGIDFTQPLQKKINSVTDFQKAAEFIYFSFSVYEKSLNGKILHHAFYNVSTGKLSLGYALSQSEITQGLFTHPIASTGEEFVGLIDAYDAIQRIDRQLVNSESLNPMLISLRGALEPGDNPVLVFYTLKI